MDKEPWLRQFQIRLLSALQDGLGQVKLPLDFHDFGVTSQSGLPGRLIIVGCFSYKNGINPFIISAWASLGVVSFKPTLSASLSSMMKAWPG